jgi:squalene synthase HpnC
MPVSHYENFPVASLLLPRRLRRPVEAIYWFARSADDIADEGEHPADWRLASLGKYRDRIDQIERRIEQHEPQWRELARMIAEWNLPSQPFRDLLDAFAQDVTTKRYPAFADVRDYCRRSANPIGRLLLHLFGCHDDQALDESDAICTSLQLLNFCQDVAIDWRIGRLYIPQDEMRATKVTESQIAEGIVDDAWRRLFAVQLERALALLAAGSPLPGRLRGRARIEIAAIVAAGERIGALLTRTRGDVFRQRPVLRAGDWIVIALTTLRRRAAARVPRTFTASSR